MDQMKNLEGVFGYMPSAISPRVLNQKGLFTVHCDAMQPIDVGSSRIDNEDSNLVKLVIPANLKDDVLTLLDDYGIDRAMLFPDMDGLSAHINRHTLEMKRNA